jgi:hypothetical protein
MSSLLKFSYKNSGGLEVNLLGPINKKILLEKCLIPLYFWFSFLISLLQAGSDHAPLLLVEGEDRAFTPYKFRFFLVAERELKRRGYF